MKFPILVIIYVFVQFSSCNPSDVSAEELVQTRPIVSTPAYIALNLESAAEEPATTHPSEDHESNQDRYDTTTSLNLRSSASPKITWNSVSSLVLSTDALRKNPDHENTFPSSSLENTTEHSGINVFNYQTPPSIFENLDHEENELYSDTRVTDMTKNWKTTLNTDLPPMYAHKFETVGPESLNDNSHTSHGNVQHLTSDEPVSRLRTMPDTSFDQNEKNVTGISLVSFHTFVEGSTSAPVTYFSNSELFTERKETSSILTKVETIMPELNLFSSENLHRNKTRETENMEKATFTTDSTKFSQDENLKSTTSSNAELSVESRAQESIRNNSNLHQNSSNIESSKDLEPVNTEESYEGLELTSRLNLETTPSSTFFVQSVKSSEVATTVVLETFGDLTTEKFPVSTIYEKSHLQNSSDSNSSHENYTSTVSGNTTPYSSYIIPVKSSDQEVLSISMPASSKAAVTVDNPDTTTLETYVSTISKLNTITVLTETEGLKDSTTVSSSISEDVEMKNTTLSQVHSTKHLTSTDDETSQTATNSFEKDSSIKYDTSTISGIEKETTAFYPSIKTTLSEISTFMPLSVNTYENTSKLLTTTDSKITTEYYVPPTKTQLSTTTSYNVDESNTFTYLPTHKNMEKENSTDSSTEHSISPQTIPSYWLPSTITQTLTTVPRDVESKLTSATFLPSHKDTPKETSTDVSSEQNTASQTLHNSHSSTTFESLPSSVPQNKFSTIKLIEDLNTEETTSKLENNTISDEIVTSLPDSYSSSVTATIIDSSTIPPETHREGKHIPFSTVFTKSVTDPSSENSFLLVTTQKIPVMKAPVNDTEVKYMQIKIEDINTVDRTNIITAIIQLPVDSTYQTDIKVKLARTHQWLDKVLTKEFHNWTGDPFQKDGEQENEPPFGNISIFYVKPTPEINASHITLTFIIYNAWRNRTFPVDFVPGALNFYSKELKESINASAVYFYHGLSTENYDLLSAVFDKYGIIIFTISLAVVGITILVCVVVFYRKKTRQSIHYLADSKLQQNLQETVGIDLNPASIILQDEKEEKGSKICDDEGWLVPIADVPVAEDNNVPNVQDTKL